MNQPTNHTTSRRSSHGTGPASLQPIAVHSSATFPTGFPTGASAMPTPVRTATSGADWSRPWRRLRDVILPPEERVLRAARRGRPVILGTAAEPWETLPDRRQLLGCLDGFRGLGLRLTCRADRVLEDAQILAWLDRDHAVRVEFRLDGGRLERQGVDSPYVERMCRAVRHLAGLGLETRLVVEPRDGAPSRRARRALRELAAVLAEAGAADLLVADDAPPAWSRQVEPLRLAHGFGRG